MTPRPSFDSLPLRKDGPRGNAWGLYGSSDELGTIHLLTPERVARAAREEIIDGGRVSVDLELGHLTPPCFGRAPLKHRVWQKKPRVVHDDELALNTQSSSQWDGFRHFGYQDSGLFYNGRTVEDIASSNVLGIHAWVDRGGIVGRGVLLDYAAWAGIKGLTPAIFDPTSIPVSALKEVASHQGTSFREGDILFVRSGYVRGYNSASPGDRQALAEKDTPPAIGVESSETTLRWLWDNEFAAIVGDHPSMEAWPCQDKHFMLHEWLLSGWGMPIGELFDLEKLSEECAKRKRWTFFFSSMPLRVPGGVASPPCGVAMF
ncbi:putative cyclase [Geosmithia morbida]|uniref:Cyclase n=1 Tax=Geosmithia morbida TaxID=1094350 RepID=A0A9P4Z2H0_9HYPO|nr:putative cyclase [Geosmithia morbida]KAF4126217.1 putative cyclase [Geosmithia morbida]